MSHRTRSIQWCENQIIKTLATKQITTYLALSAVVLQNVRTIEEQHHLDIALTNLLFHREIIQTKDQDGFTIYKLAA